MGKTFLQMRCLARSIYERKIQCHFKENNCTNLIVSAQDTKFTIKKREEELMHGKEATHIWNLQMTKAFHAFFVKLLAFQSSMTIMIASTDSSHAILEDHVIISLHLKLVFIGSYPTPT